MIEFNKVDNTSDANEPISNSTQTALNNKLSTYITEIASQSGKAIDVDILSPIPNSTFKGGNTVFLHW